MTCLFIINIILDFLLFSLYKATTALYDLLPPSVNLKSWPKCLPTWPKSDISWPTNHIEWPKCLPEWPENHISWPECLPTWPKDHISRATNHIEWPKGHIVRKGGFVNMIKEWRLEILLVNHNL